MLLHSDSVAPSRLEPDRQPQAPPSCCLAGLGPKPNIPKPWTPFTLEPYIKALRV